MSIWDLTGAELAMYCAPVAPRFPSASPALAAVLENITALSGADQAALAKAFRAAEPPKQRRLGGGITSWDQWDPMWRAAAQAAAGEHGPQWHLHPETLNGRISTAWANIKLPIGTTKHGPRDVHIPAARFWPGGVLPVGPEYAERGALDASGDLSRGPMPAQAWREQQVAQLQQKQARERRSYAEAQAALRRHIAPVLVMEPTPECIDDLAEAAD